MPDARDRLAAALGIVASYTDQTGRRRRTPKSTQAALMRAMGVNATTEAEAEAHLATLPAPDASLPATLIAEPGTPITAPLSATTGWQLHTEDGSALEGRGPDMPPLPLGLHQLEAAGQSCTLIVAPARLPLPDRVWGMTAPLYGLAGPGAGLADTEALAQAGTALARVGGDFLGLNPIHAGFWDTRAGFSPYTPSHRRRLTAFHIPTGPQPGGDLIDYARAIPAKRAALEAAYAAAGDDPGFEAFLATEGAALRRFALHQALSDRHGPFWTDWPAALHDPNSPEAKQAASELAPKVRFHAWLQYRAAHSLSAANRAMTGAGAKYGLYLDLAVGTHPAGAETWEDRDSFAHGVSLGAPPDAFSAEGQRWGLAPFNPQALIAKGFQPLSQTLRALFSHAGAVRIDHILGFDRAFWVPDEAGLPGAYMRMPRDAMLAVVRLEAARAGGVVVGEDLGNVPRGLRRDLAAFGILGCRVAIFEQAGDPPRFRDPKRYPAAALASFSTHDLPTWRGWREGHEIGLRRDLGHISQDEAAHHLAHRTAEVAGFDAMTAPHRPAETPPADQAALTHALAASRAAMVAVQAEITFEMLPQPNLPGTTTEFPNWRQPLPLAAKEWHNTPKLAETAAIMTQHGRGSDR